MQTKFTSRINQIREELKTIEKDSDVAVNLIAELEDLEIKESLLGETKFTPGSWKYDGISKVKAGDIIICEGIRPFSRHGVANALLIAAAPEMYALLQSLANDEKLPIGTRYASQQLLNHINQ